MQSDWPTSPLKFATMSSLKGSASGPGSSGPGVRSKPAIEFARATPYQCPGKGAFGKSAKICSAPAWASTPPPAVAVQACERALHDDGCVAFQGVAPEFESPRIRNEALLAERRAGVAADRRGRRRVIEADARRIDIVDDDFGAVARHSGERGSDGCRDEFLVHVAAHSVGRAVFGAATCSSVGSACRTVEIAIGIPVRFQ